MGAGAPDCLLNVDSLIIEVHRLPSLHLTIAIQPPPLLYCQPRSTNTVLHRELRPPRHHPAMISSKAVWLLPFSRVQAPHSTSHNQFLHWWPQCWHKQCRNSSRGTAPYTPKGLCFCSQTALREWQAVFHCSTHAPWHQLQEAVGQGVQEHIWPQMQIHNSNFWLFGDVSPIPTSFNLCRPFKLSGWDSRTNLVLV